MIVVQFSLSRWLPFMNSLMKGKKTMKKKTICANNNRSLSNASPEQYCSVLKWGRKRPKMNKRKKSVHTNYEAKINLQITMEATSKRRETFKKNTAPSKCSWIRAHGITIECIEHTHTHTLTQFECRSTCSIWRYLVCFGSIYTHNSLLCLILFAVVSSTSHRIHEHKKLVTFTHSHTIHKSTSDKNKLRCRFCYCLYIFDAVDFAWFFVLCCV